MLIVERDKPQSSTALQVDNVRQVVIDKALLYFQRNDIITSFQKLTPSIYTFSKRLSTQIYSIKSDEVV